MSTVLGHIKIHVSGPNNDNYIIPGLKQNNNIIIVVIFEPYLSYIIMYIIIQSSCTAKAVIWIFLSDLRKYYTAVTAVRAAAAVCLSGGRGAIDGRFCRRTAKRRDDHKLTSVRETDSSNILSDSGSGSSRAETYCMIYIYIGTGQVRSNVRNHFSKTVSPQYYYICSARGGGGMRYAYNNSRR